MIEWLKHKQTSEDEFTVQVELVNSSAYYRGTLLHVDKNGIVVCEGTIEYCFMWDQVKLVRVFYT